MLILNKKNKFYFWIAAIFFLACFNVVLFLINHNALPSWSVVFKSDASIVAAHVKKPDEVRGIYITANTAGINRFGELIDFIKNNDLNAAVVDVKSSKGEPAFLLKNSSLAKYNLARPVYNIENVIAKLHQNNIYAIARIAVFQDPYLVGREPHLALQWKNGGVWTDYKGVKWLDPTAFGVWQYNVTLAREAYERGFDEIQFDYIRFPSDGNTEAIKYAKWDGKTPKEVEMEKFFTYVGGIMRREKIPVSADMFGLVCCMDNYDLGIGQVLERALPHFDFISPMMYPSHYSAGTQGYKNPASYPYEIVKWSMDQANGKITRFAASSTPLRPPSAQGYGAAQRGSAGQAAPLAKLRPWIQDFDIGDNYDATKVWAQIKATRDTNAEGFLIWNARNVYTTLK